MEIGQIVALEGILLYGKNQEKVRKTQNSALKLKEFAKFKPFCIFLAVLRSVETIYRRQIFPLGNIEICGKY